MRTNRRRLLRASLGGLAAGLLAWQHPAAAAAAPPLCGAAASSPPAPPVAGQPPLVQSWLLHGRRDGPLPDCSGLRVPDVELLVRVIGSYRAPGTLDDQIARIGAVSAQAGLSYWSFSDRRRQVLVRESAAVQADNHSHPRADFSAADLRSGMECVFVQTDNRIAAPVAYAMQLVQTTPQSVTLRVENLDDIRMLGFMVVAVREMQWLLTVDRLGPGLWGYRSLLALHRLRLGPDEQHRLSNLSRSVALFDHLVGRQSAVEQYR